MPPKSTVATAPIAPTPVTLAQVEQKLLTLRGQRVLLDSDVAALYGVKTKEINQAIQRNPDKFLDGYIIQLNAGEWKTLRSQFATLNEPEPFANLDQFTGQENQRSQIVTFDDLHPQPVMPKYPPTALTEKGLYMLATILKSKRATATTIAIVETYSKLRDLTRTVSALSQTPEKSAQKPLMKKSAEIMSDILGDALRTTGTETTLKLNLALLSFEHTIKRAPAAPPSS